MTPEELQDWRDYKQRGDAAAHGRLCERYLDQVKRLVGRMEIYLGDGALDREDLCQAGVIGLIDAVEKFDPERNVEFLAYARRRIRGAVYDELRALDELSARSRRQQKAMRRAQDELKTRLQRDPSEEETAAELGFSLSRFRSLRAALEIGQAVAPPAPGEGEAWDAPEATDGLRAWLPEADGLSPAEKFRLLADRIDRLPERVRFVLGLYYHDGLTLKEIADVLQLTESRVCQIHGEALVRLRQELRELGQVFVSP